MLFDNLKIIAVALVNHNNKQEEAILVNKKTL